MKNAIEINGIKEKKHDGIHEVTYNLAIRGNAYNLTYRISGEEIDSVPLLCDAVVVSFLVYAVRYGLSFYSEYPMSETLYYNLTKHAIPQMSMSNATKNSTVQVNIPLTKEVFPSKWVGTGISMGVDSFATMHEYKEACDLEQYKLTHLVHLKTGAHHGQLGYYDQQKEDELFLAENNKVRRFCQEYGYKLVVIETNLYAITCTEFGYGFDTTSTFRNLGCILLLQNKFDKYYYASSYNMDEFKLDLCDDSSHYEKWVMPYISNGSVSFYSANTSMNRIEKTRFVSQFEDSYENLHVCWYADKNCGRCKKCVRTLVTLDILGVLEKYAKSFNLEHYYKNRNTFIAEVILQRKRDSFYMEIYRYMQKNNYKMPSKLSLAVSAVKVVRLKIEQLGMDKVMGALGRRLLGK